jgi:hypothetical protein
LPDPHRRCVRGAQPSILEHDAAPSGAHRLSVAGVFDGELIAFADGNPDFIALTDRMLLTRDPSIPIAFVVFDVLSVDGESIMQRPYWQRRELLEGPQPRWHPLVHRALVRERRSTVDGRRKGTGSKESSRSRSTAATHPATVAHGSKVKNRAYWKYELESEAAIDGPRHRTLRAQPACSRSRFAPIVRGLRCGGKSEQILTDEGQFPDTRTRSFRLRRAAARAARGGVVCGATLGFARRKGNARPVRPPGLSSTLDRRASRPRARG